MTQRDCDIGSAWFLLHAASLILTERHAKINEVSRIKPTARRHIRGGFNSHFDLFNLERLR